MTDRLTFVAPAPKVLTSLDSPKKSSEFLRNSVCSRGCEWTAGSLLLQVAGTGNMANVGLAGSMVFHAGSHDGYFPGDLE